ncbi:MAG: hypothetical protein ACXAEX_12195 [Promethearchaeota archaeon]
MNTISIIYDPQEIIAMAFFKDLKNSPDSRINFLFFGDPSNAVFF